MLSIQRREMDMQVFEVKLNRAGGSGVARVTIPAATPDEARRIAESQFDGYVAIAVRTVR
jgi:hypothetical protein